MIGRRRGLAYLRDLPVRNHDLLLISINQLAKVVASRAGFIAIGLLGDTSSGNCRVLCKMDGQIAVNFGMKETVYPIKTKQIVNCADVLPLP
jgi:hypothetical protein